MIYCDAKSYGAEAITIKATLDSPSEVNRSQARVCTHHNSRLFKYNKVKVHSRPSSYTTLELAAEPKSYQRTAYR